jgi:glycosyltransferase involved in cell wall biosynthesis
VRVGFSLFTMAPHLMTGTATYARGLVNEFARADSPVDLVLVVNKLMAERVRDWSDEPLTVRQLSSLPLRDTPASRLAVIAQALAAPATVKARWPRDVDLIHYPLTLPVPRAKRPVVMTLHDVQHHDQPQFFSRRQRAWRHLIYDAPARAASLVITDSEHAKARIIDTLGIPGERIQAISLGIDHATFHPDDTGDDALLEDLGLPPRFVLYPAGLWRHKNHRTLIDAIALLEDRELVLLLTGPTLGRLEDTLAYARERGVEERVRHLGFVSRPQLAALYRHAQALVFPSLYEGFGTPPLEAMACGCPVASSREGSLGEACGSAAISFDARRPESIAAAVDGLLQDPARLRERGIAWAGAFTWRAAAERHLEAYRRAAAV